VADDGASAIVQTIGPPGYAAPHASARRSKMSKANESKQMARRIEDGERTIERAVAYRPSPTEFPATLEAVPREERLYDRKINGLIIVAASVCGLAVSGGYAFEFIAADDLRNIWKPGIGIALSALFLALAIWTLLQNPCFVPRGNEWVALYERGKRKRVFATYEATLIEYSSLRTVKLIGASLICMAIGGVGVPVYLAKADSIRFVNVAWLASAFVLGFVLAIDILIGRISSKTVKVDGVEYILARWP